MKLPSYKDAIKMSKEALSDLMVPARVAKARKQAELKMCELDEKLATKTESLQEVCTRENVDFEAVINLQDDIALLERRKTQYQQILDEMFPEEK